jgi:hypothetical protein
MMKMKSWKRSSTILWTNRLRRMRKILLALIKHLLELPRQLSMRGLGNG